MTKHPAAQDLTSAIDQMSVSGEYFSPGVTSVNGVVASIATAVEQHFTAIKEISSNVAQTPIQRISNIPFYLRVRN